MSWGTRCPEHVARQASSLFPVGFFHIEYQSQLLVFNSNGLYAVAHRATTECIEVQVIVIVSSTPLHLVD